jgi:dTMP kinase
MFICFEGIDGCGKSTQARLLHSHLLKNKRDAILLREPSEGAHGQYLRYLIKMRKEKLDPLSELNMFALDRFDDLRRNILPALEAGRVVVMDRYFYSNLAYQGARGVSAEWIRNANYGIKMPDATIVVDAEPEWCMENIKKSGRPLDYFEDLEYLHKVRTIYRDIKEPNVFFIDGMQPVEKVHEDVLGTLAKFI